MARRKGRGRLSSIDLLPPECGPAIAWAANELRGSERTQQDIYEEFYSKLEQLIAESHGELDFKIPSKSAFNRYSLNLATLTRRLDDTREIAAAISETFNAEASDDLTLIAAELLKTLIFELMTAAGEAGASPKDAMQLAAALKSALQAQSVSTMRRQKVEADLKTKVGDAVEKVGQTRGFTTETRDQIINEIMGVVRK